MRSPHHRKNTNREKMSTKNGSIIPQNVKLTQQALFATVTVSLRTMEVVKMRVILFWYRFA